MKLLTNWLIIMKTFFTYDMRDGSVVKTQLSMFDNVILNMKYVYLQMKKTKNYGTLV